MALLDTFSFVKTFRSAGSDEDRAAAIAQLVNGLVESNGAAAATRADLARVAGDIVKIEQKVAGLGEELSQPIAQSLGATSASLMKDMGALRGETQERLSALEARVDALGKELANRMEMQSERVGSAGRKVIGWNLFFLLLFGAGAAFAALNWPMIQAGMQKAAAPAAATAPATPAAGN